MIGSYTRDCQKLRRSRLLVSPELRGQLDPCRGDTSGCWCDHRQRQAQRAPSTISGSGRDRRHRAYQAGDDLWCTGVVWHQRQPHAGGQSGARQCDRSRRGALRRAGRRASCQTGSWSSSRIDQPSGIEMVCGARLGAPKEPDAGLIPAAWLRRPGCPPRFPLLGIFQRASGAHCARSQLFPRRRATPSSHR